MPSSFDDYEIISHIGAGCFGNCEKVKRISDGKVLVWKALDYGLLSHTQKQVGKAKSIEKDNW